MEFKNKSKLALVVIIFLTLFYFISKTAGNDDYIIAQKIKSFINCVKNYEKNK